MIMRTAADRRYLRLASFVRVPLVVKGKARSEGGEREGRAGED